jgi:hypothetical protein
VDNRGANPRAESGRTTVFGMAISVAVRSQGGEVEQTCTHLALDMLCERARELDLPMLGLVDDCDDTVFNRSQMRLVVAELRRLAEETPGRPAEAARRVLDLTTQVERRPQRYLVFNGD